MKKVAFIGIDTPRALGILPIEKETKHQLAFIAFVAT